MKRLGAWALVALAAASCSPKAPAIIVDVRTDFVPGAEFFGLTTEATLLADGTPLATQRASALGGDDYLDGWRVAEWHDVEAGTYDITTALLDQGGRVIAQRRVRTTVRELRAITIVLSRDCREVECPSADAPEATECFGGHCVPPECTDENRDACTVECAVDADCAAPSASCASARCLGGACLAVANAGACASGQYCDPDAGCLALPAIDDGGAGRCASPADCDDGIACTTDACDGGACAHALDHGACTEHAGGTCDASAGCVYPCTPDTCTGGPCQDASCVAGECVRVERCGAGELCCDGSCFAGTDCALARPCAGQSAGTACRPSAGPCDVAETCDGTGDTCPPDALAGVGVECRGAAGPCDVAETCDGSSAACPSDALASNTTVCRSAASTCDLAERCTGSSADCPADVFKVDDTPCGGCRTGSCAGGTCIGGGCPSGTTCVCPGQCSAPGTSCF